MDASVVVCLLYLFCFGFLVGIDFGIFQCANAAIAEEAPKFWRKALIDAQARRDKAEVEE